MTQTEADLEKTKEDLEKAKTTLEEKEKKVQEVGAICGSTTYGSKN